MNRSLERVYELIGQYGVQCSETKELAPSHELIAAVEALTALEDYGYVYTVNGAYTMFSDKKPPDDAYDEGTLVAVAAIRGEEKK